MCVFVFEFLRGVLSNKWMHLLIFSFSLFSDWEIKLYLWCIFSPDLEKMKSSCFFPSDKNSNNKFITFYTGICLCVKKKWTETKRVWSLKTFINFISFRECFYVCVWVCIYSAAQRCEFWFIPWRNFFFFLQTHKTTII